MDKKESIYYINAQKQALRDYAKNGYLMALDEIINQKEIISEVNLGTTEIPLKKIVGTYTHSRSVSFSKNFLPLLAEGTEFEFKWSMLYQAHLAEGIRDPIKVYEYLNQYYVIEGNKRVSVMKYAEAYSIMATVHRVIPKYDDQDPQIKIYYGFLEFYKKTGINTVWFSDEHSFEKLFAYLETLKLHDDVYKDVYDYFSRGIYLHFRKVYLDLGGEKLTITTGDAFLEYAKIYGVSEEPDAVIRSQLKGLWTELETLSTHESIQVQTEPVESTPKPVLSAFSTLVSPRKKLKVAFAYPKTIKTSGWSYGHELGRLHIEDILGDHVNTTYIENVPQTAEAYEHFKKLAKDNDIIFTTSSAHLDATLKTALEFPHVKFLNCSESYSYKNVNTYSGRLYEPRFLTGMIAGAMTQTDILGYVAVHPTPGIISTINSFALGARLVNPYVKVKVRWIHRNQITEQSDTISNDLVKEGADIICHQNTPLPQDISKEFGAYTMVYDGEAEKWVPDKHLASPIWNWGIFYEKIIKNMLSDKWKIVIDLFGGNSKLINFWWGLNSEVVDILYSKRYVPKDTQKLVELMKRSIISNTFHPFTGPIYDQAGILRIDSDEIATNEQIFTMDWFVNVIEGTIPPLEKENVPIFHK